MAEASNSISTEDAWRIRSVLSPPRLSTYEPPSVTAKPGETSVQAAVRLYQWNAEVSAAFWPVINVFEVAVRNAISTVISQVHGQDWAHDPSFINKLPNPTGPVYNPRKDLKRMADLHKTTGKVIPELKMSFWEKMLTKRHDGDFWSLYMNVGFPYLPPGSHQAHRNELRSRYERVRKMRNRLGHHEAIFDSTRFSLQAIFFDMVQVLEWREPAVSDWVMQFELVQQTLTKRPT